MKLVNEDIKNGKGVGLFQRVNEIAFVDKSINDWEKLIRDIPDGVRVVLLQQNEVPALEQISNYLSLHSSDTSKFSAIHLISHGSDGELNLVGQQLNKSNLSTYEKELDVIKESLGNEADILIYGCDVAKTQEGKEFIEELAKKTGADIAASDDLTGNTSESRNSDWDLEYQIGEIETTSLEMQSFNNTLGSNVQVRNISFTQNNHNLYGDGTSESIDYTYKGLVFESDGFNITNSANHSDNSLVRFDKNISMSHFEVGLPISIKMGAGNYDANYPVQAAIATPNSVKAGDDFSVATKFAGVTNPTLNIDAPEFEISAELMMKSVFNGHFGLEWENVVGSEDGAAALFGETNNGGATYTPGKWEIDQTMSIFKLAPYSMEVLGVPKNYVEGQNEADISFAQKGYGYEIGNNLVKVVVDPSALNINQGIKKTTIIPHDDGMVDLETIVTADKPIISMQVDIDDLIGDTIPEAAFLKLADGDIKHKFGNTSFFETNVDWSILSVNAIFGLTPIVKTEFDVQDVEYQMSMGDYSTGKQSLGSRAYFTAPTDGSAMNIKTDYYLECETKTSIGLEFTGGFDIKMVGAEGKVFGFTVPAIFPDGSDADDKQDNYFFQNKFDFLNCKFYPIQTDTNYVTINAGSSYHSVKYGDKTDRPYINDIDLPTYISTSVSGASKEPLEYRVSEGDEGSKAITITIFRTGNTNHSTTIDYEYVFGTGLQDDDLVGGLPETKGTITFAENETQKEITINIQGDTQLEENEYIELKLSSSASKTVVTSKSTLINISSDDASIISGNGLLLGTNSDDLIITTGGDSGVYAGAGNDEIQATSGNNTIDAGAGNDVINLTFTKHNPASHKVDGGTGTDTLTVNYSETSRYYGHGLSYKFYKDDNTNVLFKDNSAFEEINNVINNKEYTKFVAESLITDYKYGYLEFSNIENQEIVGRDASRDLFIHNTVSSVFNGLGGNDTVYADLSDWTSDIVLTNTQEDRISITEKDNALSIQNIERLLLKTGSGNDHIDNSINNTNDHIDTGTGDDVITTGGGDDIINAGDGDDIISTSSFGTNTIDAGTGNDVINLTFTKHNPASHKVDGGTGTDTLTVNYSETSRYYGHGLSYKFYKDDNTNVLFKDNSAFEEINNVINNKEYTKFVAESLITDYKYGYLEFSNIENQEIVGRDASRDLFIHNTVSSVFNGLGGNDTVYADLSDWTSDIVLTNTQEDRISITEKDNALSIQNIERLLLKTGSGNDHIDNSINNTNDHIDTGTG
ncbi:DUF4347 domain-containing protein, partial [Phocoenobacter atlanticus]